MMKIRNVTVLGAGLMGHGIVQVAAQVGEYEVSVRDINQEFLDKGINMIRGSLQKFLEEEKISEREMNETLGRIHPTLDLREALTDADLIIEAVPEDFGIKKSLFAEVEKLSKKGSIMASNTSSISITSLASATHSPERFCGMHFFNPPQLMKLVEVVRGAETSQETIHAVVEAARRMGKEPVVVKDSPGFVVNRILIPALNEALCLLNEDVAEPQEIDKAVRLGLNWPIGPLRLLDYVGIDTVLAIMEVLERDLGNEKYRPCPLLKHMVKAGLLGKKSGKGLYDWRKRETPPGERR